MVNAISFIFPFPAFKDPVKHIKSLRAADPYDGNGGIGINPTDPNQFRATITGRTLAVSVDNANNTQVIVRNASGSVVLNSQFYGFTAEQLSATGAHTIEIRNGGLTLVGSFTAR